MRTNYDAIASSYDRRYELHDYGGIRTAIFSELGPLPGRHVLEIGCGTGRWLAELTAAGCDAAGLDASSEMLARARTAVDAEFQLGVAESLPWEASTFDAVLCVNALHHFVEPDRAIREAGRVLRPGGKFLSFGLDPSEADRWYLYDFFPEAVSYDRERYPSAKARTGWLLAAGFVDVAVTVGERLSTSMSLPEAERAGVLERSFMSQFDGVSEPGYRAGLERLTATARKDPSFQLVTELTIYATVARKPACLRSAAEP